MNKARWVEMTSDFRYYRGCQGKKRHPNKQSALRHIKDVGDTTLHTYKCRWCGKHHVGHSR